ncbi:DNA/RNA non-specific endonuclease [Parachlamydia sp. AcF125]|uniref:DNA/RNA non-specific endonuclease n=1 Tax=Parachlamydia sp. AcF125 TaxID=2795736 RepID=UPI001BCA3EFA|nr:DNA/RNA non-specific endonuclease [Parachlamydia sp. AcF125]MBS4169120.1 Nuclease [Parachlamydia sp. AcF125]
MNHRRNGLKLTMKHKYGKYGTFFWIASTAFILGYLTAGYIEIANLLPPETELARPQRNSSQLFNPIFSPRGAIMIKRPGYTLEYDGRTRNAQWVYECLTAESLKGKVSRDPFPFQEDPRIPKIFQNTLEDFKGSGFDRGHLAPAADHQANPDTLRDTFYLSNMSPQVAQFNRGYWAKMEKYVRDLTKSSKTVHVLTGPLFLPCVAENGKKYVHYQVIGPNNVAVPTHFFKVIARETEAGSIQTEAYVLPNQQIAKEVPLNQFKTSVQEVEKASGVLFH